MICGQCGHHVYYRYEDGSLDIEGTGPMWDFAPDPDPEWFSPFYETPWWMLQVAHVVVHSGVTRIGNHAFHNVSELRSIWVPGTVTEIGTGAFAESGVVHVMLPNPPLHIGSHAFFGCANLEHLILPDNVRLGAFSFARTGLRWLQFDGRLASADDMAFGFNSLLTVVELPPGGALGNGLFDRCGLTQADLSKSGLETLPDNMFSGCERMYHVTLPPRVRSLGTGSFIDTDLRELVLPATVEEFHPGDVVGSDELRQIVFLGKKAPNCTEFSSFSQKDLELVIREDAEGFDVMPWRAKRITRLQEAELKKLERKYRI